jgi:hypothetical protein
VVRPVRLVTSQGRAATHGEERRAPPLQGVGLLQQHLQESTLLSQKGWRDYLLFSPTSYHPPDCRKQRRKGQESVVCCAASTTAVFYCGARLAGLPRA